MTTRITLAVFLAAGLVAAQLTVPNAGTAASPASVTTTGTLHALEADPLEVRVGFGSVRRAAGPASAAWLPTGWAIDPIGQAGPQGEPAGFTIQLWYRPAQLGQFAYLLGDAAWSTGTSGPFRLFQNGAANLLPPAGGAVVPAGNLMLRGPLADAQTVNGPLATGVDADGWVFLAIVHDSAAQTLTWYVNGSTETVTQTAVTGTGSELKAIGYDGSQSPGPEGWTDDLRLYRYARTSAQVMSDFVQGTLGQGAGGSDVPALYYPFESSRNAHTAIITVGSDPEDVRTRLITTGTFFEWGCRSPQIDPSASAVVNVDGPSFGGPAVADPHRLALGGPAPMSALYLTQGPLTLPRLEVGHRYSTPALPQAIAWPDPLMLQALGVVWYGISMPYTYSAPNVRVDAVPGVFQAGDRIDVQWLAPDPTWPQGVAASNRTTFLFVEPLTTMNVNGTTDEHLHAEARGASTLQETGFFELWNTGREAVTSVTWDLGGTGLLWDPQATLNSGGSLATLDTFRFRTEAHTGLNTTTLGPLTGQPQALTFDFQSFQGPIDHCVFDAATIPVASGAALAGSTLTVTFANAVTLTGTLAADPNDPEAAILDL